MDFTNHIKKMCQLRVDGTIFPKNSKWKGIVKYILKFIFKRSND